jgi:hypothetical protein
MPPPSCNAEDIELFMHIKNKCAPLVSGPINADYMEELVEAGWIIPS